MSSSIAYGVPAEPEELTILGEMMAHAFGMTPAYVDVYMRRLGRKSFRCVKVDGEVAGGLAIYTLGQWFGGRSVPMAGLAAVAVPPERRGKGVARALLEHTLRELHSGEMALSTLYPATHTLYRSVGYEQSGNRAWRRLATHSIGLSDRTLPVRPVKPRDPEIAAIYRAWAERESGVLDRGEPMWERIADPMPETGPVHAYVVGPAAAPEGYVIYIERGSAIAGIEIVVRDFVALTASAARRLLTLLADHRSVVKEIAWPGAVVDPVLALLPELEVRIERPERWHLRIVHVPAALRARGYPAGVEAELHLQVRDRVLPENDGAFVLRVKGGWGEVARGGRGELELDVRGLAPLYSGYWRPAQLAAIDLLAGPPAAIAAAATIFAGPEPWMADFF
jgi:predicted acetyltransferase